ncbi:ATP-dependent RNA helicase DDX39A [Portunus trituberculatus]|uniref:ATP-dependent RNA helicase DDX39A n=1 Tax=Portunus trituberculatus TaxID=210409 RepID=A0A5B7JRL3_PORTR|nr:ATP-dependent RNA helicase DDX39A [Portunus trituberculatus]
MNFPAIAIHRAMQQEERLSRYQQFKDFQKVMGLFEAIMQRKGLLVGYFGNKRGFWCFKGLFRAICMIWGCCLRCFGIKRVFLVF